MDQNPIPGSHEELHALLEKNLELSHKIYKATEKTRRYIFWGEIISFVRLLIIAIPLVLAFIYLRPYIEQTMQFAQKILGPGTLQTSGEMRSTGSILDLIDELKKQGIIPSSPTK